MADVWSAVRDLDEATQRRLAEVLEKRGADPQQQAMRQALLQLVPFPDEAAVLDVGCGTGVLTRVLAGWPRVSSVIGVDPTHRHKGYGSLLLRHGLAQCDRDHATAYLESSNPANIPLYERHGFVLTGEAEVDRWGGNVQEQIFVRRRLMATSGP